MLRWHAMGFGTLEAWGHTDGTWARCVVRLENWPGEYRLTAKRDHTSGRPTVAMRLAYEDFDVTAAQRLAAAVEAEFPAQRHATDPPEPAEVLSWRPPTAPICAFRHAWRAGADPEDRCACGKLSRGWARAQGITV